MQSVWAQSPQYDGTRITIQFKNGSAESLIKEIERQSGLMFSYDSRLLMDLKSLSYKAKNKKLSEVLVDLSKLFNLDFVLIENQMVIKTKVIKTDEKPESKQNFYTISGTIKDEQTGESLIGANVAIAHTPYGTISNNYGFFSIRLPEGTYQVNISYLGFETITQSIELKQNTVLKPNLKTQTLSAEVVEVVVDQNKERIQTASSAQVRLTSKDLERFPEFSGEVGLIKTLETIPGIQTLGDGSSFFFVRGGRKDQNLILLDEAPIYNPSHLFGFYSVINPEIAKEIKTYKADLPVQHGDRLSSLTTIMTRDGHMNQFGMTGMINPFIYRISVETPIVKNRVSAFVSFRHSTFEWLFKRAMPNMNIFFYDINLKLKYKINENNYLYYSFYFGKDQISNQNENQTGFGIYWSNFASTLRWNHIFNSRLFSNTTFYASAYEYQLDVSERNEIQWSSFIKNITLKTGLTYFWRPNHRTNFGYELNLHSFNPGNINTDQVAQVPYKQSLQAVLYLSHQIEWGTHWRVDAGLRASLWANSGPTTLYHFDENYNVSDTTIINQTGFYQSFFNADPRLSFQYLASSDASFKLSYSMYHQYIHLISNSAGPFTSLDVWLPSDQNIKPQRAQMWSLGHIRNLNRGRLELSGELYYKIMHNQIEYADHANMLLNPLVEGELRFGTTQTYGFEVMMRKHQGRLNGWLSYTYSRVWNQFKDLNQGFDFDAYYDRPHHFSVYLNYKLSARWHLSANWTYASGLLVSSPVGYYTYSGQTIPIYGQRNNERLPAYHRMDVSVNWQLNRRDKRFKHMIAFSIYNLYNRKNMVQMQHNKVEDDQGRYIIPSSVYDQEQMVSTQTYVLGILPSLSYKFQF